MLNLTVCSSAMERIGGGERERGNNRVPEMSLGFDQQSLQISELSYLHSVFDHTQSSAAGSSPDCR